MITTRGARHGHTDCVQAFAATAVLGEGLQHPAMAIDTWLILRDAWRLAWEWVSVPNL
jgi:hypothetical protein